MTCVPLCSSLLDRQAPGPSKASVIASFKRVQAAIAVAQNVVIVGGGPTAVEAAGALQYGDRITRLPPCSPLSLNAGEIKAALPKASVTIVHGGPALLSGIQNGTNGAVS